MRIRLELSEEELKSIIKSYFQETLGDIAFDTKRLKIEVKSKQNFKSEWESAAFRAIYEGVS